MSAGFVQPVTAHREESAFNTPASHPVQGWEIMGSGVRLLDFNVAIPLTVCVSSYITSSSLSFLISEMATRTLILYPFWED